ncbi:MarR family winged helix-turn-helix transcriptional regulator [Mycolicibacterium arenosum]|uniref:MarR family transcriptional regulator n=1 Tax=Mycolicibacterium arenosum TaxID=2952157 RepID=A0ABT1LXI8_9MYCO|nr:MarR family transcriptional regulator [Mycolicibacterium sp. CAU 1645]MCP9271613.1 MarR family transcriptional regulator [Mycolicibacterium sp. CAU 1645]
MSDARLADDVWRTMAAVVFDNRDAWKRTVIEHTGLPFSRVRVLRRLAARPMTAKEIAKAASMDAPATTVAVNDLQERGLVIREADPTNRRSKLISLTAAGRELIDSISRLDDPAPGVIAELPVSELRTLQRILGKVRPG